MVAGDRHAAQDRLGFASWSKLTGFQRVANDFVVDLDIEPIAIERDARAAVYALSKTRSEAFIHISVTRAFPVLEGNHESAGWGGITAVHDTAPAVNVDRTIWCHHKLARMPQFVGKDGRAESVG